MKKIFPLILISVAGFLFPEEVYSQLAGYQADAIRYNQTLTGGTSARIRAMGGAGTALGGDIGLIGLNPAGLGFYNRSEFSITPTFNSSRTDSDYFGATDYQFRNKFSISNMGLVFRSENPKPGEDGWQGGAFSISYQQLNNFNRNTSYTGNNPNNTYVDAFFQYDDQGLDQLRANNDAHTILAYETSLIAEFYSLDDNQDTVYFYDTFFPVTDSDFPVRQAEFIQTSGSQGQWNFAYGGNFGDKIYLGGGIGITNLYYRKESTFEENVHPDLYQEFPSERENFPNNRLVVFEDLLQRGGGINATLGVITRPLESLTVGLSYRTPTFYSIEETSYLRYQNYFVEGNPLEKADAEQDPFNFNLRTPGVLNIGAAYFIQKSGLITADIEYTDYSNSRLTANSNYLRAESQGLAESLNSVINYRLGGEYRHQNLRFRLGYAYQPSPYVTTDTERFSRNTISGGLGLKFRNFYADLAVIGQNSNRLHNPYQTNIARYLGESGETLFQDSSSPEVSIEDRLTTALLTVGFTF